MMYNGANCYSQDYQFLMNQIASKGYLAVVTTEQHPSDKDLPGNTTSCMHAHAYAYAQALLLHHVATFTISLLVLLPEHI